MLIMVSSTSSHQTGVSNLLIFDVLNKIGHQFLKSTSFFVKLCFQCETEMFKSTEGQVLVYVFSYLKKFTVSKVSAVMFIIQNSNFIKVIVCLFLKCSALISFCVSFFVVAYVGIYIILCTTQTNSLYNISYFTESFKEPRLWVDAISQNAFDTGAGMGIFIPYSSFMSVDNAIVKYGIFIPSLNNLIR